jgi:hypothetical protein
MNQFPIVSYGAGILHQFEFSMEQEFIAEREKFQKELKFRANLMKE